MRERKGFVFGLFLMIAVGYTPAAKAVCNYGQDIDLRAVYPDIFQYLGISDQGKVGVCYAHAAATLIDFYRIKLKADRATVFSTNPVDAAQVAALESQDGDMEGGQICDVVNGMVKRGYGYVSTALNAKQLLDLGLQTQVQAVNRIFIDYLGDGMKNFKPVDPKKFAPAQRKALTAGQKAYLAKFDGLIAWIKQELTRRGVDLKRIPADAETFAFIQKNHADNDYANFPVKFEMFIASRMQDSASFKMPNLVCRTTKDLLEGYGYVSELDRTIDYQKAPVGISFCANVLTRKNYRGYASYGKLKKDCLHHAVVVIGKRFGRQGCEYLIRNSWGYGYPGYAWETSEGDIWVAESALAPNLTGTSIIR